MRRLLIVVVPLALALVGCSGGADAAPDAARAFATARQHFVDAGTVDIEVSSAGVPQGVNGVTSVRGAGVIDASTPKFKGSLTATLGGVTGAVDVIAIGDQAWMSLFTQDYNPVDLNALGAPNPAQLFAPDGGVAAMLDAPAGFTTGERRRLGADVLQHYTGKLSGKAVVDALHIGKGTGDFTADYGIDTATGQLRQVVLTGPFYAGTTTTYTVHLTQYGTPVDIQQP